MTDDKVYLHHILQCIQRIEENTARGRAAFLATHTLQDAVLRNLQTLSESTQRLSDKLKATQPDIPWQDISGFRNILVHDYLGVDLKIVWGIIERDLPPLKTATLTMLHSLDD